MIDDPTTPYEMANIILNEGMLPLCIPVIDSGDQSVLVVSVEIDRRSELLLQGEHYDRRAAIIAMLMIEAAKELERIGVIPVSRRL